MKRTAEISPTADGRWQVTVAGIVSTVVETRAEAAALLRPVQAAGDRLAPDRP